MSILSYALVDVVHGSMPVLLLVEDIRVYCIHCDFEAGDVEDTIVKILTEFGHLMEQEESIDVYGVACDDELPRSDPFGHQVEEDLFLGGS